MGQREAMLGAIRQRTLDLGGTVSQTHLQRAVGSGIQLWYTGATYRRDLPL